MNLLSFENPPDPHFVQFQPILISLVLPFIPNALHILQSNQPQQFSHSRPVGARHLDRPEYQHYNMDRPDYQDYNLDRPEYKDHS